MSYSYWNPLDEEFIMSDRDYAINGPNFAPDIQDIRIECKDSGLRHDYEPDNARGCSKTSASTNIETPMVILRTQGVIAQTEILGQETNKFEPCRFCSYHSLFEHNGEDPIYKKGVWIKKGQGVCTKHHSLDFQNNRGMWYLCDEDRMHECHFYEKRNRAG